MKNYVLYLERAVNRKKAIIKELDHYSIDADFYPAIDWHSITDEDVQNEVDPEYLKESNNSIDPLQIYGVLACWLSHRKLWKSAVDGELDSITVFEDDARFSEDTKPALAAIDRLKERNFEYDIIFLYNAKKFPLIPVHSIDDRFKLNLIKYNSIGAVGYVMSRNAMKVLLNDYPLMNMGIDALMHWYWLTGLRTYILTPQVVFHGSDLPHYSYLGESGNYNTVMGWKLNDRKQYVRFRRKRAIWQIQNFPSRLVSKYIPQRLAFSKRLKNMV